MAGYLKEAIEKELEKIESFEMQLDRLPGLELGANGYFEEDPSNPTETVYGYVPRETVLDLLEKHGGIEKGLF